MLESAACGIVICGDKNAEGMKEFLYADCAAAAQNILLCIHGLGLGGVWYGVAAHSDWQKFMAACFELPPKLEPVLVIAVGWPNETNEMPDGTTGKLLEDSKTYLCCQVPISENECYGVASDDKQIVIYRHKNDDSESKVVQVIAL